jgi:C4-dicarboxylate-specific signal transduction histidine kinase
MHQLTYNTLDNTFSSNAKELGLPESGTQQDLDDQLWQQLLNIATTGHGQFITLQQENYFCMGQRQGDNLQWVLQAQPHLQRQQEQWQQDAKLASVGQVMAGICHEVNQPLNAMRLRLYGLQQLATMGSIPDLDNHLKELDNQIERCANTLVNMRQLVGHQPISHSQFDLAKSIQQVHKLLSSQLAQQSVKLTLPSALPESLLFGQAQRFEQVLINLINNARDAILEQTDQQDGEIQIFLLHQCGNYQLQVIDNGPGIPEHLQEKVFTPYYTSKQAHGTGLGLALCQDLVNELDGSMQLDSKPGRTCFTISLPKAGNQA